MAAIINQPKRRSIGSSISEAFSASADVITALPKGIQRLGSTLGKSANVTDLYLDNWVREKRAQNVSDSVERIHRLEELRLAATAAGVAKATNISDFVKEIEAMDI